MRIRKERIRVAHGHAQINSFYLQKENELKVRLRTLVDKKKVLQSDTRRLKHAVTLFNSIQEAFVQFEQELNKIQVNRKQRIRTIEGKKS